MKSSAALLSLCLCLTACGPADISTRESDNGAADPALIGWWKFDEGEGDVAADASGHGNAAEVRNGRWSDGKYGGSLEMTGTTASDARDDGIVVVPLSASLKSTADAITVMSWTYRTAEHNVAIVAHEYPVLFLGFHGPQFKWQFQGEPADGILARAARLLRVKSIDGAHVRKERGASCYADLKYKAELDKWIHVAATYDGWWARLYVDGVEICSQRFWGSIRIPESPFTFSGYLNDAGEIIDEITGNLDDLRIYNRALDATEIRNVYRQRAE